ncbi:sensor domain-containing diguanylate cyclase [Vibrio sp. S4M6]|uniref:sensor domain-containing diguanylate cyclase n=1 Tax=Vibrio sinus TaxID=2946865 RepID=UPI00202ABF98|nr:sensor domain-containing diguanylate cyclase [Vibrio sinus]MCL9783447.1 sensor domain-containing diguanylate cyclase [Vibrio sinus]
MDDAEDLKIELYDLISSDHKIFELLYTSSLDGIWYWDTEQDTEWVSPEWWERLGYGPDEHPYLAEKWRELFHPDDVERIVEAFQSHSEDPNHPYDHVVRYLHKDGSTVWTRCRGIGIRNEHGKVTRMLGSYVDVTAFKKIEQQLRETNERLARLNLEDPLTGVLNRDGLMRRFEEYVLICQRQELPLSIAFLDIDNFKGINDKYGHLIGDDYLVSIANCLQATQRATDKVARLGGDEFVIVMLDTDEEQAKCAAERIRRAVQDSFGHAGGITVSIGLVSMSIPEAVNHQGHDLNILYLLNQMISVADNAMYESKRLGKNTVSLGNLEDW